MTRKFAFHLSVIPNQVLNLALNQVQGLSNSGSKEFGISAFGGICLWVKHNA